LKQGLLFWALVAEISASHEYYQQDCAQGIGFSHRASGATELHPVGLISGIAGRSGLGVYAFVVGATAEKIMLHSAEAKV
jgi:hypothetical protein